MHTAAGTLDASSAPRFISSHDGTGGQPLPPSVARVLGTFRALGREEKMQALLHYAKTARAGPRAIPRASTAPSSTCPSARRASISSPELRDGKLYFYADLNPRQSPTIAAFLAILFSAINGHPPETTLAHPVRFRAA